MTPPTLDEADQALRVALTLGDPEEIERASKIVDDLERTQRRAVPTLHASALWYTERGFHVFPLTPRSKIPLKGSRGCKDATGDPEQIHRWWDAEPDANVGIATGHLVDVVDVDGHEGQRSRAQMWDEIFAQIDADAIGKVLTPRPGGMHIYVPATGNGNAAGIAPSVDIRGRGGYVVAPPSVTDVGTYRWLGQPLLAGLAGGKVA